MDKAFKRVSSLIDEHGFIVAGHLPPGFEFANGGIAVNRHRFDYDGAIQLRDWLIAATGGEGLEGREWWIVPEPDAVATGWTTPESALNFAIGLLGRKPRDDEIIHVRETLPAAPQVGEGDL